jgi:S-methylmethionine-dependent homocysteine/selenocysteine methylase
VTVGALDLRARLATGPPLLLDGATGTELEHRGAACDLPLWSARALVESPEVVEDIHADYAAAGADLLTANSFRTQARTLARGGLAARAAELSTRAVRLARAGAARAAPGRAVAVLGSAPPLEDCYRPDLVPSATALAREHAEHAANLAAAGVDAILVETMNTVREAVAATRAARDVGLPALVSFVCGPDAVLLSGEPLGDALSAARDAGADAVLVNCLPPSRVAACLPRLRDSGLPFGVYANLGAPTGGPDGARSEQRTPAAFAEDARAWRDAGCRVIGGCCGTTPAHVHALARLLHTSVAP